MAQCQSGGSTDRSVVQEHSVTVMTRAQRVADALEDVIEGDTVGTKKVDEEVNEVKEAAAEMKAHCTGGHRSKLKHPINIKVPCGDCIAGSMRGDYAHKGGCNKVRDLETACVDIDYLGGTDIDGRNYRHVLVMLKSQYAEANHTARRDSGVTGSVVSKQIIKVQVLTDPGGKHNYKVQRVGSDHGTEYKGQCKDMLEKGSVKLAPGGVDVHTQQAVGENRHKMNQRHAATMANKALPTEEMKTMFGGSLGEHSNDMINHSEITAEQKRLGITAYEQQTEMSDSTLTSKQYLASIPAEYGEAMYIFVKIKDRTDKNVGARAVRAVFVGMDSKVRGAIRAVHYERVGVDWLIHPTMSGITKWKVIKGYFPLMAEADLEEAHEHKHDLWDSVFASMGERNAKWATGEIKRALVEKLAESDSDEECTSEPVSDDWVVNEVIDHTDKVDSEHRVKGPAMRDSYRVNWRGVAKHNTGDIQDDNGWFLAEELCRTDPLLVQKYEEQLIIEADNGPVPLMTGVNTKAETKHPGSMAEADDWCAYLADTKANEESDMNAIYSAVPMQAQARNERRIEALVDFVMHQESPVYFGLDREEVKNRIEQQAKYDLMADVYSVMEHEAEDATSDEMCVVELSYSEWSNALNREEGKAADEKEMNSMKRLRLRPITGSDLEVFTKQELERALKMRLSRTRKRPTPEEEMKKALGKLKSRLVMMDLKCMHKVDPYLTYSAVPGLVAWKLMIGGTNLNVRVVSTTDFQTAFLQSFRFDEMGMDDVLCKLWNDDTRAFDYYMAEGSGYGMQIAAQVWKQTLDYHLTGVGGPTHEKRCETNARLLGVEKTDVEPFVSLGFTELKNQGAVYKHIVRDIRVSIHIDDPWIDCGGDGETNELKLVAARVNHDWIHMAIRERFVVRDTTELEEANLRELCGPLDYLSMRCSVGPERCIEVDNDQFLRKIVDSHGMTGCNSASIPATKENFRKMAADKAEGKFVDDKAKTAYQASLGMFQWQGLTMDDGMKVSNSLNARYAANPVESCDDAVKHCVRYCQGMIGMKLVTKPWSTKGLVITSDSDLGGMHSTDGELRSRGGASYHYNEFCVDSDTAWVGVVTSSGYAETLALSDALRKAMYIKYIGEELGMKMPDVITIHCDATVAISFAAGVGAPTTMRHIDLRAGWVNDLRNRKIVKTEKIDGKINPSDFMTKILSPSEYKRQHAYFVVRPEASNVKKNGSIGIKMLSADDAAVDKRIAECNQLKAVNSWDPVTGFH